MKYEKTSVKCPSCGAFMDKVPVSVEGAKSRVISYQCPSCGDFTFDRKTGVEVYRELRAREQALKIQQKLVNLSHNRLGAYFNKHIVRSLNLKAGQDIFLSVPDKKHILISLKE